MTIKINLNVLQNVLDEVKKETVAQTENVRNEAIDLITTTAKTGRIYKRGAKTHQASAPGEPYANDTGATMAKIRTEIRDEGFTGVVVFGGEIARYLEHGTQKMEPRPVARPALANKQEEIQQGFMNAVKRGLSK